MTESIIVGVITVAILIAVALTFVYFYFKGIREEISDYWQVVMVNLNKRLDKIPNLIETLRVHTEGQEELIGDLIKVRSETWPIRKAGKERVYAELDISGKLHEVWGLGKRFEELRKNTNYLELQMEFKEVGKEIDEMSDVYNHKVRRYNKLVGIVVLGQLLGLMKFRKLSVFEFEG